MLPVPHDFNPHPAFWPGAAPPEAAKSQSPRSDFNPHPAFWPGAANQPGQPLLRLTRFQSSPGLLAGCCPADCRPNAPPVRTFQSSPGLLAGCCPADCRPNAPPVRTFQSSPGLLAGCCPASMARRRSSSAISILTRPFGRVLPAGDVRPLQGPHYFNPHPAFWPGAALMAVAHHPPFLIFQSSPGLLAGCCMPQMQLTLLQQPIFQSSPGLLAGCCPVQFRHPEHMMPDFNPHPAFWPGAALVFGFPI